jgi:hypothetical protein
MHFFPSVLMGSSLYELCGSILYKTIIFVQAWVSSRSLDQHEFVDDICSIRFFSAHFFFEAYMFYLIVIFLSGYSY